MHGISMLLWLVDVMRNHSCQVLARVCALVLFQLLLCYAVFLFYRVAELLLCWLVSMATLRL